MRRLILALLAASALAGPAKALTLPLLKAGANGAGVAPDVLADSIGVMISPSGVLGTTAGAQLGITNSKAGTLVRWIRMTGDPTNQQNAEGAYHVVTKGDPGACATAPGFCVGAGDDGGATGTTTRGNTAASVVGVNIGGGASSRPVDGVWTLRFNTWDGVSGACGSAMDLSDTIASGVEACSSANQTVDVNNDGSVVDRGFFVGNGIGNSTPRATETGLLIFTEKAYVCTGVNTPASITGIGTVTCPAANRVPVEVINKFITAAGKAKEMGAACANFDSARTPEVCMRFRRGALLTNEGTATYGSGTMTMSAVTGTPGTVGPWEGCYGPEGPPATGVYCSGLAQGQISTIAPAAVSGSVTQTYGNQPIVAGDALILAAVARSTVNHPTGLVWSCPDGTWTLTQPSVDSSGDTALAICRKIATDATASFTMSFASSAQVIGAVYSSLFVYKGVSGFDPGANAIKCSTTGSTPSLAGPSGQVTTAANAVVLTIFTREQSDKTFTATGASLSNQRVRLRSNFIAGPFMMAMDQLVATAGAVTAETVTAGNADGFSTCGVSMLR